MLCSMSRAFVLLYSASLVLLPWSWFPPFPWLHEHAQWSDVVFMLAAAAWLLDRARDGDWPEARWSHAAMAAYVGWAFVSHLATGFEPRAGSFKLAGLVELCALALITEDVASRKDGLTLIGRSLAMTGIATGIAAVIGVALWDAGLETPFVSHAGDLDPDFYARATAGLRLPNLLASFVIVASGAVAHRDADIPQPLRRLAQWAFWIAALLSFSRGILGLVLAALVRNATTTIRRRIAAGWAVLCAVAILCLTYWNVGVDPLRPWEAHLRDYTSSGWPAVTSSGKAFVGRPVVGSGPGNLPGSRKGAPCNAHLTPLNVAATLGAPALAAFAMIPYLLWRDRRRPTDFAAWGALAGLGLDALGQDVEDFRHLWVAFGIAGRAERREEDE